MIVITSYSIHYTKLYDGSYRLARRSLALLLLQRDEELLERVRVTEGAQAATVETEVNAVVFARRIDLHLRISLERKRICRRLLDGVIAQDRHGRPPLAERLSTLTMNPWTGVPLLLLILYFGLYQFVGGFGAGTVVDFLEGTIFEEHFNPFAITWFEQNVPWFV